MRVRLGVCIGMIALAAPVTQVRADDDEPKKPDMHELARVSSLPKAHKDFSAFLYRPKGDRVIEQADANRLLFRTPDGQPDGYAERHGDAVIYYAADGKVRQVQPLPPEQSDPNLR